MTPSEEILNYTDTIEASIGFGGSYGEEVHALVGDRKHVVDIRLVDGDTIERVHIENQVDGFIVVTGRTSYRLINTDSIVYIAVHKKENNA